MIDFLKYKWLYFLISIIVIGCGMFAMVKWGFKYSIDFVGGTNLEYQADKTLKQVDVKKIFDKYKIPVENLTVKDKFIISRSKAIDENVQLQLKNDLEKQLKTKITLIKTETVGPTLGRETMNKTWIAAIIAVIGILLYMSYAFRGFNFALAAILANVHDFFVVIGCYAIMSHFLGAEVDTMFVTAVLTSMSFSLHDTIVIFDKIREYRSEEGSANVAYFANKALTETMVRSLNNSMTIIFMLLALTLLGGTTIKFLVATLLIGTITGTYSSPFIATPIVVWLEQRSKKK